MQPKLGHITPDYHNYSFFGRARKDGFNGVTDLSAKIKSGQKELTDADRRFTHQTALLQARLNTYLDALHAPCTKRREYIGPVQAPYLKLQIPKLRDVQPLRRISRPALPSFDQFKAASSLKGDFVRADPAARNALLDQLVKDIDTATNEPVREKLISLQRELMTDKQEFADHETLSGALSKTRSREKHTPVHVLFFKYKARSLDRKIAEIERPSSYEEHRVEADGKKVQNKSLYAIALTDFRRQPAVASERRSEEANQAQNKFDAAVKALERNPRQYNTQWDVSVSTEAMRTNNLEISASNELRRLVHHAKDRGAPRRFVNDLKNHLQSLAESYVEKQFVALADAIRHYQEPSPSPDAKKQLEQAVLPILRSSEREAVHRFIRTMTKQLRKIADDDAGLRKELEELEACIPDQASGTVRLIQALKGGTGRQLRLEDEAQRMLRALPMLLELTKQHAASLRANLMSFDYREVSAILADLSKQSESPPSEESLLFLGSARGNEFVAALATTLTNRGMAHVATTLERCKDAKERMKVLRSVVKAGDPDNAADRVVEDLQRLKDAVNTAAVDVQHLFMKTSDYEFWQREAVDKIATPIPEDGKFRGGGAPGHRTFKQMTLRAAALGRDDSDVLGYMKQGIANTLKNRSMAVEGSKAGGVAGSFVGNLLSTPISAAGASKAPILLVPGLLDMGLMPAGWAIGVLPGAVYGSTVLNSLKKKRLAEAGGSQILDPWDASADYSQNYTSRSKKYWTSPLTMHGQPVKKPVLDPIAISRRAQFMEVHGQQFKTMGKEVFTPVVTLLKYIAGGWWRHAREDLWDHGPKIAQAQGSGASTERGESPRPTSRRVSVA